MRSKYAYSMLNDDTNAHGCYSAKNAVDEWLAIALTPEVYVLALTQFATLADTEVVSPIFFQYYVVY